jgi:hypothetical protein
METLAIPAVVKAVIAGLAFYALILAVITLLLRVTIRLRPVGGRDFTPFRTREGKARIEKTLVEFFARSHISASILNVLAARRKPTTFKRLGEEVRHGGSRPQIGADVPESALRGVLFILLATRLARMGRAGFSITSLGREVHRRIGLNAVAFSPVPTHGASASRRTIDRQSPRERPPAVRYSPASYGSGQARRTVAHR